MSDDSKNIMIGDLLVRSGLVTSADLTEAMQVSRRLGMPIGRVLTMSGNITPDTFQLALEAQSLIRDGVVPIDVGIEALGLASRDRQPLKEALGRIHHPHAGGSTNRLGELLVDAYIITNDQLDQALKVSIESGLPLGGTLVTQGIIHASLLPTVLRAQEQIRDGVVTREAAIEELKAAMKIWAKAEAAMKRSDYATEAPVKPSVVMSTLRDTLESTQPEPIDHRQPAAASMPMPVQAPPQQQPSQLHAQLQQQQQQYYQNQPQPQHQPPHAHPHQHQQPQPQPMQHQQQQPMQQPMPTPIYGYNTPYGHAPYGGPAPDDPWGSWHGSVPRHHGLGVPLPGFPQPPAMPPEGYAPPPGYPAQPGYPPPPGHQMPPQGAPPPQNWNMPPQQMPAQHMQPPMQPQHMQPPMPPQHMPPQMPVQQSNLHAQLQQQQHAPDMHPLPAVQPEAAPPPMPAPPPANPAAQAPLQQSPVQMVSQTASPSIPTNGAHHAETAAPETKPVTNEEPAKESGQLKNVAAQLASRLGWAAPTGSGAVTSESSPATDLPSPKKLSWNQPQQHMPEPKVEEPQPSPPEPERAPTPAIPTPVPAQEERPAPEPQAAPKPEPVPVAAQVPQPVSMPSTTPSPFSAPTPAPFSGAIPVVAQAPVPQQPAAQAPLPVKAPAAPLPAGGSSSTPSSEFKNPFSSPPVSPFSSPGGDPPRPPADKPAAPSPAAAPNPAETPVPSTAAGKEPPGYAFSVGDAWNFKQSEKTEPVLELPKQEKPASEPVEAREEEDEDEEPDFKMEFDLELPAPFNKPLEQASKETAKAEPETPPTKQAENPAEAPAPVPVEALSPGYVAGFGKGTKITLKSDYAPTETGRLFAITEAEALTLLSDDTADDAGDDKKETSSKGKKGKGKASQSQTKLAKQTAKGKKGQSGKSQTGLPSAKEPEPLPAWLGQKNQNHQAAAFGKKSDATGVPDFLEDLIPAAQIGSALPLPLVDLSASVSGPVVKASNTQTKMASIKQRAVSLSVSNLLPVPLEIAEAQAELAYIVEHRGAPMTPPVTFTPPAPLPRPAAQPAADTAVTIVELLTLSGFFTKKDIVNALDKALEDSSLAPDLLFALGLVKDDTLDVVVRCQSLTRNRYLTTEQAIYVLGAVRSGRLTFEQALSEIGK